MKIKIINIVYWLVVAAFLMGVSRQASACSKKRFLVASYGTDKEAITKLVSDVNKNKGGRIIFPEKATIILNVNDDPSSGHRLLPQESSILFPFRDCKYLEIDLNGSTIIIEKNHSSKYALFLFHRCKTFELRNGTLIGDAFSHDYSNVLFNGKVEKSSHEWGHGVMVIGSKGKISNVTVSSMTGDGVYVASQKSGSNVFGANVEINNCDISLCRRNGISSASTTGFYLTNSVIHEIGSYKGLAGTDPCSGIDFEYEDGVGCKGEVYISGSTFQDCEKKTITTSNIYVPKVLSLEVDNCSFSGSSFQIANMQTERDKIVKSSHFDQVPINCGKSSIVNCVFMMGSKLHYAHGTHFKHCQFIGSTDSLDGPYGCAIAGYSMDEALFEDCSFKDVRGMNNSSPAYQGISAFNFPLVAHFSRCSFQNTSFVKGNPKIASSFSFDECSLSEGCMIYNEGGAPITFHKSVIKNVGSYQTQSGEFVFTDCDIIQDDESVSNPLLFFGTHKAVKSRITNTLKITPKMKAKGVQRILLKEE